jgi:hypothetical protein
MPHSLDVNRLAEVFEGLRENSDRLTSWECDRLEEWESLWARGIQLSERQLEVLEQMYVKVP